MAGLPPSSSRHGATVVSMPLPDLCHTSWKWPRIGVDCRIRPGNDEGKRQSRSLFFHYYRYLPIPFAPHNATRFTKVIKYYLMIFVRRIYLVEETL